MIHIPDNIAQFDVFMGSDGVLRAVPLNEAAEKYRADWTAEGNAERRACAIVPIPPEREPESSASPINDGVMRCVNAGVKAFFAEMFNQITPQKPSHRIRIGGRKKP